MTKLIPNVAARTVSWDDDVLEEISHLGEDSTVHKMKQLLRQLSIMSSIEHMNIVLFYGTYISSPCEVKALLEFCEGGSLEAVGKRIKELNARVGENIAARLAEGVFQGLAYLDTKKIIHLQIKPSNILLSREGIVKLCDIAISYEWVASLGNTDPYAGSILCYMAPERICGQRYTIRSDVWSTGICLLELVQNRSPFPDALLPIELMMFIAGPEGDPPRLEDEPGLQWSDDMKDFIKQMLTVDSLTRPTPKEMLAHPWVINNMKQQSQMARWIRKVWGWSRDNSSSSGSDSPPSSGAHTEPPHVSSDSNSPPEM
ncbi:kinase-like domain-containing protein [Mycena leptocephala]|nr:kinase-like domain-containing protein [Mycena leptocephala]